MTRATHGVLFDIGECLLDETARHLAATEWLSRFLGQHGVSASPERLQALYRQSCRAPVAGIGGLMVQTALAAGANPELAARQRDEMPWDAVPMTPIEGAIECVAALRSAGLRVAALANQPMSALDDLRSAGLVDLLDDIWLSDAVGLYKPDPRLFQVGLDAWDLPASRVAYVGDRPDNDIGPARRLGMYAVRLLFGPHADQPARDADEVADFESPSLAAVARHLLAWSSSSG